MKVFRECINANRKGKAQGIYAICSAHPMVIEAAIEQAQSDQTPLLIEATANQVNQYGGYTGMKPKDFKQFVLKLARQCNFPDEDIFLGGDHLGPVCWQDETADSAMSKAEELISQYVAAGFKKIHLDCSMPCSDDATPLSDEIIAQRAALLCVTAERCAQKHFGSSDIVYIIGTEVPAPGGANESIDQLHCTKPSDALQTLEKHRIAFKNAGVADDVWSRVVGLVVQPGVEFDHTAVIDYSSAKAQSLKAMIPEVDNIVFEAHSTDYQTAENYQKLVQDHFAILKVGPQLTFAMREGLFALSYIEEYLVTQEKRSGLRAICEQTMLKSPQYWEKFYQIEDSQQSLYRQFSYSDRIRYYWTNSGIQLATERLFSNLKEINIPLPLISQFLPEQYHSIRSGHLKNTPRELVKDKIKKVIEVYAYASWKQNNNQDNYHG